MYSMYKKEKLILQLWHILCAYVFNSDDYNPLILFKSTLPFNFGKFLFG